MHVAGVYAMQRDVAQGGMSTIQLMFDAPALTGTAARNS